MSKESILNEILALITKGSFPQTKEVIQQFLDKEINGDTLLDDLTFSADLNKGRKGILVYLLTSAKIVKIEIDRDKVQSSSCYLKEVIGVNRTILTVPEGNNAQVIVEIPQGNFGLLYPTAMVKIDSFFQNVDATVRRIKIDINDPKTGTA
jgi:hypothetical protein